MIGEKQDVLFPVPQGRQCNETRRLSGRTGLRETAGLDEITQIGVGCGNNFHIDCLALGRTERPELLILQYPQQLALHHHTQRVDLVEKQRSAVGFMQEAWLLDQRAR